MESFPPYHMPQNVIPCCKGCSVCHNGKHTKKRHRIEQDKVPRSAECLHERILRVKNSAYFIQHMLYPLSECSLKGIVCSVS